MNRFIKQSAWAVAVLSLLLASTACSSNSNNANSPSASASGSPSASASIDPSASASASPSDAPESSSSASPSASVSDTLEGTGTYNGLGDTNSIEIDFNGTPTAFRIDADTLDKLSNWDEGVKVKFKYVVTTLKVGDDQVKQFTIVSIDKQ